MKRSPKEYSIVDAVALILKRVKRSESGCLLYTFSKPIGIGYRTIRAKGQSWYVHRLMYYHLTQQLPEVVMHSCDNTACVEITHLRAGTHQSNVADKVQKGRHCFGHNHYRSRLTSEQVEQIRVAKGTYAEIGALFKISKGAIWKIKKGLAWKSV